MYTYVRTVYALQTYESENIFNDAFKLKKLLLKMHLCTSSKTSGVGHTHVYHKVLLEIITPKAVVLPIDSDKNDCISSFIVTIAISKNVMATLCYYCYKFICNSTDFPILKYA